MYVFWRRFEHYAKKKLSLGLPSILRRCKRQVQLTLFVYDVSDGISPMVEATGFYDLGEKMHPAEQK